MAIIEVGHLLILPGGNEFADYAALSMFAK
jgi:hypothetical protein